MIDTIVDFSVDHPIIFSLLFTLVAGVMAACEILWALSVSSQPCEGRSYHYEYTGMDGEMHIAEDCGGYRYPYCQLSDGTRVFDIKSWKRVKEE